MSDTRNPNGDAFRIVFPFVRAIERARRYAKSHHTTPEEHDDIMVAVRFAEVSAELYAALAEQVEQCLDPMCEMCPRHDAILRKARGEG